MKRVLLIALTISLSGSSPVSANPCPTMTMGPISISESNYERMDLNIIGGGNLTITTNRAGKVMYRDRVPVGAGKRTAMQGEQLPLDIPQTRLTIVATLTKPGCDDVKVSRDYLTRRSPSV